MQSVASARKHASQLARCKELHIMWRFETRKIMSICRSFSLTTASHYRTILEALFLILSQNQPPRVVDNICGAVSRMMMANRNSVPLEKVCDNSTRIALVSSLLKTQYCPLCFTHLFYCFGLHGSEASGNLLF